MPSSLPNLSQLSVDTVGVVGPSPGPPDRATDNIVGLLQASPPLMLTLRGLLQYLQLCQVSKRFISLFNCDSRVFWRSLLQYAESRTIAQPSSSTDNVKLLLTTAEVDASTAALGDDRAAAAYKRAFIDYVIFRSLFGYTVFTDLEDFRNETWFNLIWFDAQIKTFLARSNGSIPNVLREIRSAVANLRRKDPSYPPIPADFFIAAVNMIEKLHDAQPNLWNSKGGKARVPLLIEAIASTKYY